MPFFGVVCMSVTTYLPSLISSWAIMNLVCYQGDVERVNMPSS